VGLNTQGVEYQSGRSYNWLKMKNPDAPASQREASEDWSIEGTP
jgi:hypothetical protein